MKRECEPRNHTVRYSWSRSVSHCSILNHVYLRSEIHENYVKLNQLGSNIWLVLNKPLDTAGILAALPQSLQATDPAAITDFLTKLGDWGAVQCTSKSSPTDLDPSLGKPYKSYLDHIARKRALPLSAFVEVTYNCNEHCVHCAVPDRRNGTMSLAEYAVLMDDLSSLGTLFVTFSGGEPFVRPDFIEIVSLARQHGFSVRIYTNATRLLRQDIDALCGMGVFDFDVSIYGASAAIHDQVTRVPGSFSKTMASVRAMLEKGMRPYLKCPVMGSNVDDVPSIKRLAETMGLNVGFFARITARTDGDKSPHRLRLSDDQFTQYLRNDVITEQARARLVLLESAGDPACEELASMCSIDPFGNVRLCNQLDVVGGNIGTTSFKSIWTESPVFAYLRSMKATDCAPCTRCDLRSSCDRCPGLALLEDGDILGCSTTAKWEAESLRRAFAQDN